MADDFSHECANIAVNSGMGGTYVLRIPDQTVRFRGDPHSILTDNGPEFTSPAFIGWTKSRGIAYLLIGLGGRCRTATSRASTAASEMNA